MTIDALPGSYVSGTIQNVIGLRYLNTIPKENKDLIKTIKRLFRWNRIYDFMSVAYCKKANKSCLFISSSKRIKRRCSLPKCGLSVFMSYIFPIMFACQGGLELQADIECWVSFIKSLTNVIYLFDAVKLSTNVINILL